MVPYTLIFSNAANVSGKDFIVIEAGQFRSFYIDEIETWGDGTSSQYTEFGIFVPSALGTTPPTAVVPSAPGSSARMPAFSGVFLPGTWSAQSTIPAVPIGTIVVNGNGQHNIVRPKDIMKAWDCPAAGGASPTAAASLVIRPTQGPALFASSWAIKIVEVG